MKVVGDRVLVAIAKPEEKTESGIIMAGTPTKERNSGTVFAVGGGKFVSENGIEKGQTVYFRRMAGVTVDAEVEGKGENDELFVMDADDIYLIL